MRPLIFLLALTIFSSLSATALPAKVDLSGRIVDADLDMPLEFATVSAYDSEEALVTGAITDSTGKFLFELPKGQYRLQFEFIGYTTMDTTLELSADYDLGDIKMSISAQNLEGVTVKSERSRMTLKLDKQIFDVAADITSQGGTANEVLDNVPMVNVSQEGVVSLRGNSVKVLINGKPSALADNNALQGIPASNIEKVEIMTNPSARYEAAGSGGIINIILKDESAKNWGGQVSASVGIPTDYRLNGSFSRTQNKWTYFGNAGVRYSDYFSVGEAERISQLPSGIQILREDLDQERNDKAGNAFFGADFRPNEKTTFSASYSYYHQTDDDLSTVNYTYSDDAENLQRDWVQTYDYLEPANYHQIEASWAQDFSKEGSKLFVLFQNDFWDNDEQALTIVTENYPTITEAFQQRTRDIESSNDYLLQSDYEQKLGEHGKLEIGLRGEMRIISSDYLAEIKEDGEDFIVYRDLENELDYYERIGAAYVQYAFEKDKWGVQLGLRSEYTNVKVEDTKAETEDIKKSYNWVFPSATVSYKFSEKLNASLAYSKRIQRPGFWQLNPFGGIENPNELRFGNPDLDPSFRDLYELKVLYNSDKLTVSPFLTAHYIDGFYDTQVLQDSSGLVTYFPINLEQERILVAGLTINFEPIKGWQINAEASAAEFRQTGFYEGVDFGNSFQQYSGELGIRGKLPQDIRLQATFYYYGGQRYLQFYDDPYYGINAGLSRKFLSDRLQVSLNVRNLFELSVYRGGATLPTFTNSYARRWIGQRFGLTAAWDIGADVRVRRARGRIR